MAQEKLKITLLLDDKASGGIKKFEGSLGDLDKQAKKSDRSLETIALGITGVNQAFELVRKGADLAKRVFEFSEEGAQLERLRQNGERLAESFGQSFDQIIETMRRTSKGTVPEADLILAANRALRLEVAKTPEEFEKLTIAGIALGRAMGRDAREGIMDATDGLGRMSVQILDNIGIVGGGQYLEDYAKNLGITADEMDDATKKALLLNRAHEAAIPLLDETGGLVEDNASAFEGLRAEIDDLSSSMKTNLADASAGTVSWLGRIVHAINESRSVAEQYNLLIGNSRLRLRELRFQGLSTAEAYEVMRTEVQEATEKHDKHSEAIATYGDIHSDLAGSLQQTALEMSGVNDEMDELIKLSDLSRDMIDSLADEIHNKLTYFYMGGPELEAFLQELFNLGMQGSEQFSRIEDEIRGVPIAWDFAKKVMEGETPDVGDTLEKLEEVGVVSDDNIKHWRNMLTAIENDPVHAQIYITTFTRKVTEHEIGYSNWVTGVGRGGVKEESNKDIRQHGGWLRRQWTLVGDPGPWQELISPWGYVFPADVTKELLKSGIPFDALRIGGGIPRYAGEWDEPTGRPSDVGSFGGVSSVSDPRTWGGGGGGGGGGISGGIGIPTTGGAVVYGGAGRGGAPERVSKKTTGGRGFYGGVVRRRGGGGGGGGGGGETVIIVDSGGPSPLAPITETISPEAEATIKETVRGSIEVAIESQKQQIRALKETLGVQQEADRRRDEILIQIRDRLYRLPDLDDQRGLAYETKETGGF